MGVLRCFAGLTEELLCQGLFFNNVAGLRLAALLKGRLWRECFSCGVCKIFGSAYFKEQLWMTASVYSFYNLKSSICDILQIYKIFAWYLLFNSKRLFNNLFIISIYFQYLYFNQPLEQQFHPRFSMNVFSPHPRTSTFPTCFKKRGLLKETV